MIGNFSLALPCILDGNKECLEYDIYSEGALNFEKMADLSAGNDKAVVNFKEMARLCRIAYEAVKRAPTPIEVTTRTCNLLDQLIQTIKKTGVANCQLLPNVLNALNALAILKPTNLRSILSTHNNLKHLLNLENLIE